MFSKTASEFARWEEGSAGSIRRQTSRSKINEETGGRKGAAGKKEKSPGGALQTESAGYRAAFFSASSIASTSCTYEVGVENVGWTA